MAANSGKLAGKVVFITGASRGIGRAIALKVAKDGANVVVAAKTRVPHPKLPGTIYTVAEEVEKAGGKCLPFVVDIRYEDQIQGALDETVRTFGKLDILINNASAINLTNTKDTSMKSFDLMNSINGRGTFLCSKLCLPHLIKSGPGSHILNISPPLNMSSKWFQNHVAYTMAKYGMSMCVLGMSEELKEYGISVNALWPKTAIYTAAMEMLGGGKDVAKRCRKADIMADAAYVVLSQPQSFTGHFLVDETLLREKAGVTNFEPYACDPGSMLLLDFFLDAEIDETMEPLSVSQSPTVEKTFEDIQKLLGEEAVKTVAASFSFQLSGSEPGTWYLDLKNGSGSAGKLDPNTVTNFDVQMKTTSETFVKMFSGKLIPTTAFMSGELKIKGNAFKAMKLESLLAKIPKPN